MRATHQPVRRFFQIRPYQAALSKSGVNDAMAIEFIHAATMPLGDPGRKMPRIGSSTAGELEEAPRRA